MKLWAAWLALLDRQEEALPLASFRVAVGLTLVGTLLSMAHTGVIDLVLLHRDHGGLAPLSGTPLVQALGGPQPAVIYLLWGVALLAAAGVTLGLFGRWSAFIALQAWLALVDTNPSAGGSYDELLANALWINVLAPTSATASLDCWRRTGHWATPSAVPAWGRWLVAYQILLVYGTTGLQKVSASWVPGGDLAALYGILLQPNWSRFPHTWLGPWFPVTQAATAVVWCWEVAAPLWGLLFALRQGRGRAARLVRRLRLVEGMALLGLVFHLGVEVLLCVGSFTWISLAFYPAFIDPWREVPAGQGEPRAATA